LAAKSAAPGSSKVPESAKAVGAGGTESAPNGAAKVRELPSPGKRVADFGTNISVDDYLVGKYTHTHTHTHIYIYIYIYIYIFNW
jgi:hypothetical protein